MNIYVWWQASRPFACTRCAVEIETRWWQSATTTTQPAASQSAKREKEKSPCAHKIIEIMHTCKKKSFFFVSVPRWDSACAWVYAPALHLYDYYWRYFSARIHITYTYFQHHWGAATWMLKCVKERIESACDKCWVASIVHAIILWLTMNSLNRVISHVIVASSSNWCE